MSTGFRYSDVAQSTNSLKVLIPEEYRNDQVKAVNLIDSKGRVIETGNYKRFADNRENYHFGKKGYEYPGDTQVQLVLKNGQIKVFNPKDGLKPGEPGPGNPNSTYQGIEGPGGAAYRGGNVATSPGGNSYVQPGAYNYGAIPLPFVDFASILSSSQDLAKDNRNTYFDEITGDDARKAALGLVDTDLQGITKGLDVLAPRARAEGRADTTENIARAGQIDQFNLDRIPGFNDFNRAEHDKTVESSGLDYSGRISEVLDQLRTQSTGRLTGEMDQQLTDQLKNSASDINSASGVGSISGAGVRASDRLNIQERMSLMDRAQSMIPGVLTTAQQVLQAPEIMAQPEQVPFTPSTIEQRMPIQSSISAGGAQLDIGTKATQIGTIDATHAFDQNLSTEQFNQEAGFNAALGIGDRIQGQMGAADSQQQGALNADKADAIRNQQYDAFQGAQQNASIWAPLAAAAGTLLTGAAPLVFGGGGSGAGGGSAGAGGGGSVGPGTAAQVMQGGIFGGTPAGGGTSGGGISGAIGSIFQGIGSAYEAVKGYFGPSESAQVGGQPVSTADFQNFTTGGEGSSYPGYTRYDYSGGNSGSGSSDSSNGFSYNPEAGGMTKDTTVGDIQKMIDDGSPKGSDGVPPGISFSPEVQKSANIYSKMTQPAPTPSADAAILGHTTESVQNWANLDSVSKFNASGNVGIGVVQSKGLVSTERADDMRNITSALGVMLDPNSNSGQRASALAQAGMGVVTRSYTGGINDPKTISGNPVIGQTTKNGETVFQTQDASGNTVDVPKSEILDSANSALALSAFSVLTSKADDETKIAALGAVGIKGAAANNLISSTAATNGLAALQVFNTAKNWDEMNGLEHTVATVQTSAAVIDAAHASFAATTGASVGATALSYAGPIAAGIGAAYATGVTADGIIQSNQDLPMSQRPKANTQAIARLQAGPIANIPGYDKALNLATKNSTNAMVALAVLGPMAAVPMGLGAVTSLGGTGKDSGQLMRDSWRNGLRDGGVATIDKATGAWNVTLADGSAYDIGKDGGAKLQNVGKNVDGGTERNTFDVDWSNPIAVASIPDAHLIALATGLDPTGTSKNGLFDRATAQMLNAVTSNATDVMGVKDNVRSVLKQAGVTPEAMAGRVEILRNQNMISDQEYSTYVNHINGLYGTEFAPTEKADSTAQIVNALQSKKGNKTAGERSLLQSLTDPDKQASALKQLNKRLGANKALTPVAAATNANSSAPNNDHDITFGVPMKDPGRKSHSIPLPAGMNQSEDGFGRWI